MKLIKWILIVLVAMGIVVSCNAGTTVTTIDDAEGVEEVKEDFIFIEEPELVYEDYCHKIVGVIQNNKDYTLEYIDIEFALYDAEGNNIGTAYANGGNIKPGTNWKFEAYILEDDVDTFELIQIGGETICASGKRYIHY